MCFGSPDIPTVEEPKTLKAVEPGAKAARNDEKKRATAAAGRNSTLLTAGKLGRPDIRQKTLLGA